MTTVPSADRARAGLFTALCSQIRSCITPLATVFAALALATPATATDVFLVASYDQKDACGQPQYEAAMDALKQAGFADLSSKGYFLDTRVSSKEEVLKAVEQIKQDIRSDKPKLVFTIDDAAFAMLYEEVLQQPEIRMVFTGLNRSLATTTTRRASSTVARQSPTSPACSNISSCATRLACWKPS